MNAEMLVGGLSAQIVDITAESPQAAGRRRVGGGALVRLLALVFRSIAIPIKAILMNVLGITAAYGLLVVVFQEAGARLFDFHVTGTTQVYLPLLTFAVLLASRWTTKSFSWGGSGGMGENRGQSDGRRARAATDRRRDYGGRGDHGPSSPRSPSPGSPRSRRSDSPWRPPCSSMPR